jgi:hypothetical protein
MVSHAAFPRMVMYKIRENQFFRISNFRRVLNLVCFIWVFPRRQINLTPGKNIQKNSFCCVKHFESSGGQQNLGFSYFIHNHP